MTGAAVGEETVGTTVGLSSYTAQILVKKGAYNQRFFFLRFEIFFCQENKQKKSEKFLLHQNFEICLQKDFFL